MQRLEELEELEEQEELEETAFAKIKSVGALSPQQVQPDSERQSDRTNRP